MADVAEKDWNFCLRLLSHSLRDANAPGGADASDVAVLEAVKRLQILCSEEQSEDLVARVYPSVAKLFQRYTALGSSLRPSHVLILLAILQFFVDFGEEALHDTDLSIRLFFRSCLSRLFADQTVASATLDFLLQNKRRFLLVHPGILPQFFPLILKVAAWGQDEYEHSAYELENIEVLAVFKSGKSSKQVKSPKNKKLGKKSSARKPASMYPRERGRERWN